MPTDAHAISFVPVSAQHDPLIAAWLRAPHRRAWWGDPDEELGFIRDMVEGRDPDPASLRAVRAYRKAGFRPVPTLPGRTGDVPIMQYDPNETR